MSQDHRALVLHTGTVNSFVSILLDNPFYLRGLNFRAEPAGKRARLLGNSHRVFVAGLRAGVAFVPQSSAHNAGTWELLL